jgi:hypothetical protein
VDTLPLVFSSGWASGVNAYATVLIMGLLGRFAGVDAVPEGLQRTEVLVAAFILFAVEFVADKVPYIDSAWDSVHTVIRPAIGATIGLLIAGDAQNLNEAVAASVGGGTALASHGVKAGIRLAANASPEPFSNIILSLLEDTMVTGIVVLALAEPWLAAAIAAVLLVMGLTIVMLLLRAIRGFFRRRSTRAPAPPP